MSRRKNAVILAIGIATIVLASLVPAIPNRLRDSITFVPHRNSRTAEIRLPGYPRDILQVDFPEVVHDDRRFLLGPESGGFHERDVKWHHLGPQRWRTTYVKPGVGEYSISLDVRGDEVDMIWQVHNLSRDNWDYVGATPDFNFEKAPDFADPAQDRTYLHVNGKWQALKESDHSEGRWSTQWYLPNGYRSPRLMGLKPHPKNAFGLSRDQPDNGLVAVVSRDGQTVVGQAFEKVQYVCLNSPVCVHPAAHFGDIAPGKWASAHGKFYFMHGSLKDLLRRYLRDFPPEQPAHASSHGE